jgi:hypothetical protein
MGFNSAFKGLIGNSMFSGLYHSFKSLFSIMNNYIIVVNLTLNGINVTIQELKLKTKENLQLY